jgi:hypothetical protein
MAAMTAPHVRLIIDRLVLHGIDRADAAAVRRALSGELETMLAGRDDLSAVGGGAADARLRLNLAPAADPAALGRLAGRALGRALIGSGRRDGG